MAVTPGERPSFWRVFQRTTRVIVSYSDPAFKPETVCVSQKVSGLSVQFYAISLLSIGCLFDGREWVVVAAVIFWRRLRESRIALFASLSLITFGTMSLPPFPPAPADQAFAVWLPCYAREPRSLGIVALYVFYLLFPNGGFVPRWTRWAAVLFAVHEVSQLANTWIYRRHRQLPSLKKCLLERLLLASPYRLTNVSRTRYVSSP